MQPDRIVLGGEALAAGMCVRDRWLGKVRASINLYGPTETTI